MHAHASLANDTDIAAICLKKKKKKALLHSNTADDQLLMKVIQMIQQFQACLVYVGRDSLEKNRTHSPVYSRNTVEKASAFAGSPRGADEI